MVIELASPLPAPRLPEGVTLRSFEPGRDERGVHALIQEAFADNFDYSPMPFEGWLAALIDRDDFDPSLSFVAEHGSAIVGAIPCLRYQTTGWVRQLAVRRDWRRRGVASALLRTAFAEFYRRGQRRAGLVVDSFNRTGAKQLYERAGMRVERQHDWYEKEIG